MILPFLSHMDLHVRPALTGQLAWVVENAWFNTFVYDTVTPNPRPIAWMVAGSAITAKLTTLLMGTLNDRM